MSCCVVYCCYRFLRLLLDLERFYYFYSPSTQHPQHYRLKKKPRVVVVWVASCPLYFRRLNAPVVGVTSLVVVVVVVVVAGYYCNGGEMFGAYCVGVVVQYYSSFGEDTDFVDLRCGYSVLDVVDHLW